MPTAIVAEVKLSAVKDGLRAQQLEQTKVGASTSAVGPARPSLVGSCAAPLRRRGLGQACFCSDDASMPEISSGHGLEDSNRPSNFF